MQILCLDIAGQPFRWLTIEQAAYYVAANKISWTFGDASTVLHGGMRRVDAQRSTLSIPPVIALARSETMTKHGKPLPLGHNNNLLFARDRNVCAYCSDIITERDQRTRDHVIPRARGGLDVWSNVVTAHRSCNMTKGCRTPDEARMPLVYVPYQPCRFEWFILSGRNILADQMDYLAARLPRHSRISG